MTRRSRGFAHWFVLFLGLLVCTEAAHAEERKSRRSREAAASVSGGENDRESARERRRRRREERERQKAAEAQAAVATSPADAAREVSPEDVALDGMAMLEAPGQTIYQLKGASGRTLYTNEDVLAGEGALDPVRLPPLGDLDFRQTPPHELRKLDGRLLQTVEELQRSERCEALRGASRVPLRTWMWHEHQRELMVAAGLFVFALIMGFAWQSSSMRALLPIVPLLGCAYVAYDASVQAGALMDSITRGLRACSMPLEEGDPGTPKVVRTHYEQTTRISSIIDAAYGQRDGLVERVMRDYRM